MPLRSLRLPAVATIALLAGVGLAAPTLALPTTPPSPSVPVVAGAGTGGWTDVLAGADVTCGCSALAIDPVTSGTVYAGFSSWNDSSFNGLYKSVDGGQTWTVVAHFAGSPYSITGLAVDPRTPSTVYASTESNGIEKSTDGGATWASITDVLGTTRPWTWVSQLALDGTQPQDVLALDNGGLFLSPDAGSTWTVIETPLVPTYCCFALDPTNGQTIYLANLYQGVLKSTDGGKTWASTGPGIDLHQGSATVRSLAVDPVDSRNVYAGLSLPHGTNAVGGAIYKSADAGASWTLVQAGMPWTDIVYALAVDPATPTTVYAGTSAGDVWKSKDGGATWFVVDQGLAPSPDQQPVATIAIDPRDSRTVYLGTSGVYKTTTGGE